MQNSRGGGERDVRLCEVVQYCPVLARCQIECIARREASTGSIAEYSNM